MTTTNWIMRAKDMDLRIRNFINGKYSDGAPKPKTGNMDDNTITKYSPRDGSLLYRFGMGRSEEVDQAVTHARDTFNDGCWQGMPLPQRKTVLHKLADLIEANSEELALYDCLDVGKPINNVLREDIPMAIGKLRKCADSADKLFSLAGTNGGWTSYEVRKPVGVVAIIVGWNYPLALAVLKAAPALATGNSVVLKPSEFSSLSAGRLAALAVEAGVPPGVFNVVHGAGSTVGDALATHADVDLLSFTGSNATGKQLQIGAGQSNMKRLMLECGGKSPYIVFDDCPKDLDFIAADIVMMAFHNQGEVCIAGSRLLVQDSIKDQLLAKVLEKARQIKPQDPLDPASTFGALINESHLQKVMGYIECGKKEGAELILGGERVHTDSGGYFVEPTIFDHVGPQHAIAQEEIFGPVLSVLTFNDEEEAIRLANSSCYGLFALAATENLARAQRLGRLLNAGAVNIVGASPSTSGGGVGGMDIGSEPHRESGFGYESGLAGLGSYTVRTLVNLLT